jgi:hypothetical protein
LRESTCGPSRFGALRGQLLNRELSGEIEPLSPRNAHFSRQYPGFSKNVLAPFSQSLKFTDFQVMGEACCIFVVFTLQGFELFYEKFLCHAVGSHAKNVAERATSSLSYSGQYTHGDYLRLSSNLCFPRGTVDRRPTLGICLGPVELLCSSIILLAAMPSVWQNATESQLPVCWASEDHGRDVLRLFVLWDAVRTETGAHSVGTGPMITPRTRCVPNSVVSRVFEVSGGAENQ